MSEDNDQRLTDLLTPFLKGTPQNQLLQFPQPTARKSTAPPLSLNLMLSNTCDSNCVYCFAHRRKSENGAQLSTERWLGIFREAHAAGIRQVVLTGGDPLVRKDALTLIGELVKLDMLFNVSTKCHITRPMADRLVQLGMNEPVNRSHREIHLGLDGPDSATADTMAGSAGHFHRSLDTIRNLKGRGFNLRFKSVITPFNVHRVYHLVKLAADMGVPRVSLAACSSSWYRHDDAFLLNAQEKISVCDQCSRARSNFPNLELKMSGFLSDQEEGLLQTLEARAECLAEGRDFSEPAFKERQPAARSSMTITPDGKVVLCGAIPTDGTLAAASFANRLIELTHPQRGSAGFGCHNCVALSHCHDKAANSFKESCLSQGRSLVPPPVCTLFPEDEAQHD